MNRINKSMSRGTVRRGPGGDASGGLTAEVKLSGSWTDRQKRRVQVRPEKSDRAAFYTRYSTLNQNESSTARQIEKCVAASKRFDLRLVKDGIHSDEGKSGRRIVHRAALRAMMKRAKDGELDFVVIESADRLSRDQVDMVWLHRELKNHGVELVTEDRGIMSATEIAFYAILNEDQVIKLCERSQWAREEMASEGRFPNGACYGYLPVPGEPGIVRIDEEGTAPVVRQMFAMRASGISLGGIARSLNARGITSPSGRAWKPQLVRAVLSNPRYRGVLVYLRTAVSHEGTDGGRKVEARPPEDWVVKDCPDLEIVDAETWARVEALASGSSSDLRVAKPRRGKYLLSGCVYCPDCGGRLKILSQAAKSGRPARMACSSAIDDGVCKTRNSFHVDWLQAAVIGAIRPLLDRPDAIRAYLAAINVEHDRRVQETAADRKSLRRQIDKLRERLDVTLEPEYVRGVPLEIVLSRREKIMSELNPLENTLAGLPSDRAPIAIDEPHLSDLRSALDELAVQPAIRDEDNVSRRLIAATRGLIGKVFVKREEGLSGFRGTVQVRMGGFMKVGVPGYGLDDAYQVVDLVFENPPKPIDPYRKAYALEALVEDGGASPGWSDWANRADRLPGMLTLSACGATIELRLAVSLMIKALRADRPFTEAAAGFGGIGRHGLEVVSALVGGGVWDSILSIKAAHAPPELDGLDVDRFRYLAAA